MVIERLVLFMIGIADYHYIIHVINYDNIAFKSNDYNYNYLKSSNLLQLITINDYDCIPGIMVSSHICTCVSL